MEDAQWAGALDHADVLGESCIEGAVWRATVRAIDGIPSGDLTVRCHPWSGGGGAGYGDDTAGVDTGLTSTATATATATTDATTDVDTTGSTTDTQTGGGQTEDGGDPQLGFLRDVVSW